MHCSSCGHKNTDQSTFCKECGKRLENKNSYHVGSTLDNSKALARPPKSVLKYALMPICTLFALVALWGVLGYMQGSGGTSPLFDVISFVIPLLLGITVLAIIIAPIYAVYSNSKNFDGTVKCGNCGYVGPGEPARRPLSVVLAWLCVLIAWPITVIYFLATHKYRCPKCKSTFLGMRTIDGQFVGGSGGGGSGVMLVIIIIVVIAIIGILSSVVLASLSTAREKARDATRISDTKNLQLAAELYFDEYKQYPTTLAELVPRFIPDMPADPTNKLQYYYSALTSGGLRAGYHLGASLERNDNPVLAKDSDSVDGGFNGDDNSGCGGEQGRHCYDITPF